MQEVLFKISVYDEFSVCGQREGERERRDKRQEGDRERKGEQGEHSIQSGYPAPQPNFIARSE